MTARKIKRNNANAASHVRDAPRLERSVCGALEEVKSPQEPTVLRRERDLGDFFRCEKDIPRFRAELTIFVKVTRVASRLHYHLPIVSRIESHTRTLQNSKLC